MLQSVETREVTALVNRILDALSQTITSQSGEEGAEVRHKIGILRADIMGSLRDSTFADLLLDCFNSTREAGAVLLSMFVVQNALFAEDPESDIAKMIVNMSIVFCLATESRMIMVTTYKSRDDAQLVMDEMRVAFDTAKDIISDLEDPLPYKTLLSLAGALVNHLAITGLKLPQEVTFKMPAPLPALAASMYCYQDASRWEELVDENKIVHPAFCRRELRGLSR